MRNTADVIIDQQGVYLAVGVDRSDTDLDCFVRLDINATTLLIGPGNARRFADLLRRHADAITAEEQPRKDSTS